MEVTESIESLNKQLRDLFGVDTVTGKEMFRISFSEDQFEKRLGTYDDFTREGIYLRTVTEVREVPKYRQWIHGKHIIERLTIVPYINADDLPVSQLSYECVFVFENFKGEALPPRLDVAKIAIDSLHAGMNKTSLAKYKDDYKRFSEEERNKRINEIMEYLWDPSDNAEALVQGEGIVVPSNFKTTQESKDV